MIYRMNKTCTESWGSFKGSTQWRPVEQGIYRTRAPRPRSTSLEDAGAPAAPRRTGFRGAKGKN